MRTTPTGMWAARPGEGRYPRRDPAGRPSSLYSGPTVRPEELATGYFAGQVPVPYAHRVTPRGIAWALALFAVECLGMWLALGYPGLGGSAAANDRVVTAWLPLFLLACAGAPLVAVALAADRRPSGNPYAEEGEPFGHPLAVSALAGVVVALGAVAVVAYTATSGPHGVPAVGVACAAVLATALGTAGGLLTVHRPTLRTPACWAVLSIWAGLVVREGFVWAAAPGASSTPGPAGAAHGATTVTAYAPAVLGAGVAATVVIGGVAGFVRSRAQAPLLVTVAALWATTTAASVLAHGPGALTTAPWPEIAWTLTGALVAVLTLATRTWWHEYR